MSKQDKLQEDFFEIGRSWNQNSLPDRWIKHVDDSIPSDTEYVPTMSMRDIYERYTKGEVKLAFAASADYEGDDFTDDKLDELHDRIDTTTMSDSEIYDIVSAQEEIINSPKPEEPLPAPAGEGAVDNLSDEPDTI